MTSDTMTQSYGEAVFETPDKRCVKFKAPGGVIFRFVLLNERSLHDPQGILGYKDFACVDCQDHHQKQTRVVVHNNRFIIVDPEDDHACFQTPGGSAQQPPAGNSHASVAAPPPTRTLRSALAQACGRGPKKYMFKTNRRTKRTGTKFGRANFIDELQNKLKFASKRHPGVTYTYECRGSKDSIKYFYCVDCLPLIQVQSASRGFGGNTVGPAIWVEDGFVVERDPDRPDYDPYTEDHTHFCLAQKQQERKRNRRTAPSDARGPPAKQPAIAPRPSLHGRMGTPVRERTPARAPGRMATPVRDRTPARARTPFRAAQTPVRPIKQEMEHDAASRMDTMYDTSASGDELHAELPASAPNYGVAIVDARNPHDKSIYHKSDFYLGRVFKFREVDSYSDGVETSRQYRCVDCETVTEHVPQFMGKAPPLLVTVNARYKHDPDRPQDTKHVCMTPGVPRDLLPIHFMPDSPDMAGPLRESSAAEDEDDDDFCEIIEHP